MKKLKRPGYYVDGTEYHGYRWHQAVARARYLSRTQGGRMVEVRESDAAGNLSEPLLTACERANLRTAA